MEFFIRKFIPADELGVRKCISELKKYESQFDPDYFTDEDSVSKLFGDILKGKNNGGEIFVAEIDKLIVGFVSLSIETKNDELIVKKEDVVYISDTSVLPEFRNRGIGKELLNRAYEFAKEKNVRFIKLIVFSDNKNAKALYEKDGFKDYEVTMLKEINKHKDNPMSNKKFPTPSARPSK